MDMLLGTFCAASSFEVPSVTAYAKDEGGARRPRTAFLHSGKKQDGMEDGFERSPVSGRAA